MPDMTCDMTFDYLFYIQLKIDHYLFARMQIYIHCNLQMHQVIRVHQDSQTLNLAGAAVRMLRQRLQRGKLQSLVALAVDVSQLNLVFFNAKASRPNRAFGKHDSEFSH